MASKFSTLFLILALNALQVYSQNCFVVQGPLRDYPVVLDSVAAGTVLGTITTTGTQPIRAGSTIQVQHNNLPDVPSIPHITATHAPVAGTPNSLITITAAPQFPRFLGIAQPNEGDNPSITLRYNCADDAETQQPRSAPVELQITDTDNEVPSIDLQGIDEIKIFLDTWQSNDELTFLSPIIVEDRDLDLAFANVEIKSDSELVRVKSLKTGSQPHRWTTDLYLSPEAGPGTHNITISAKDAAHTETNATIVLLISGGIQAQATTFVVAFFVGLAAYLNL